MNSIMIMISTVANSERASGFSLHNNNNNKPTNSIIPISKQDEIKHQLIVTIYLHYNIIKQIRILNYLFVHSSLFFLSSYLQIYIYIYVYNTYQVVCNWEIAMNSFIHSFLPPTLSLFHCSMNGNAILYLNQ